MGASIYKMHDHTALLKLVERALRLSIAGGAAKSG
jgi:hypothetical protein